MSRMNHKQHNAPQRPQDTTASIGKKRHGELGFVLENFHEFCCDTFDEEDDQEGALRNDKICKCGKSHTEHKKNKEGELPRVLQPSVYCGRIWKTTNSYFRYIQVSNSDRESRIVKHFLKYWKIYDRGLVISMVGDEIPLKLLGSFQSKLVQFARDAEAMVLTSGLDEGITRSVNMVFSKMDQSYKQRKVPVIGISPWNLVRDKQQIKANQDVSSRERSTHKVHGVIQTRGDTRLCQDLGHHMFVDFPHTEGYYTDSCLNDYTDTVVHYRHQIEMELMQLEGTEEYTSNTRDIFDTTTKERKRLSAPVVIVVVGGNESTLTHVDLALKEKIPVLAVKGTGGLAEFISNANSSTLQTDDMQTNFFQYIEDEREISNEKKTRIQEQLTGLLNNLHNDSKDCFVVCDLDKEGDFNNKILTVLINSSENQPKRLGRIMSLAVEWNMLKNEQVQEQLTQHLDCTERNVFLHQTLLTAIVSQDDRLDWIEQLVGQDLPLVDFNKFINTNLEELYERACDDYGMTIWEDIAPQYLWGEEKNLDIVKALCGRTVIVRVLQHLFDQYDDDFIEIEDELEQKIAVYDEMNPRKLLAEKTFNCAYPFKHLLIWAVVFLRPDIAKFAWRMIKEEPLQGAIAMCSLMDTMKSQVDDRYTDEKRQLIENKQMFEDLAIQLLNACNVGDENLTQLMLCSPSAMWGGLSALQMAIGGNAMDFISAQAVQKYMDDIWNGGVFVNVKRMILLQVMPILVVTPVMKVRVPYILQKREGLEETYGRRGGSKFITRTLQKFMLYYNSPRTKFFYHHMTYFVFLALFNYVVLVDFKKDHVTTLESVCLAWILTMQVDELYTVIVFPSANWKAKYRDVLGGTNVMGFLNALLFITGYLSHHVQPDQTFTKIAYSVNIVIFQLRVFKAYVVHQTLGPQIVMVKEMTASMLQFLLILLIFIVAYGTSSQALLYTERRPTWNILRDIIYQPYWTVYGDLGLSDIEDDTECTDDPQYCRKRHGLVYVYLGIYILLANVLLLNLLIAIFSNIYNDIYEKTSAIWRYNMYFVTYKYSQKTVFVPPFSILTHSVMFLRFLFCCGCKREPTSHDIVLTEHEFHQVNLMQIEERKNLLDKEKKETQISLTTQIQKIGNRLDKIEEMLTAGRLEGTSIGMMDRHACIRSTQDSSKANFLQMASKLQMQKSAAGDSSLQRNVKGDDGKTYSISDVALDVTSEDRKLKRLQRQIVRNKQSDLDEETIGANQAVAKPENDFMNTGDVTSQQAKEEIQTIFDDEKNPRLQDGLILDPHIHRMRKNKVEPEYVNLNQEHSQHRKTGRGNNKMLDSLVGEILGTFKFKESSTGRKKKKKDKKKKERNDDLHRQQEADGVTDNLTVVKESNDLGNNELDRNAKQNAPKRKTGRRSKKGKCPSSSMTDDNIPPVSISHGISPYLSCSDNESMV